MSRPVFYVRRDAMSGDTTDAQARRYARQVERVIGHRVEFADRTGCDCYDPDARDHRQAAADIYDWQTWR